MDPLSLSAEALLAVTGVMREKPLTEKDAARARELPSEFAKKVTAFLDETEWRTFKMPAPGDYEATHEALMSGSDPDDGAELIAQIRDMELGRAYLAQLGAARQYLSERWPIDQIDTATGPRLLPPATMHQGQAWALFSVVTAPGRILDEMLMGTLQEEQAESVKDIYPGLYDRIRGLIDAEIMERKARSEAYTVAWDRERVLRIFLGLPQEVPITDGPDGKQPEAPADAGADIAIDFSRERSRFVEATS